MLISMKVQRIEEEDERMQVFLEKEFAIAETMNGNERVESIITAVMLVYDAETKEQIRKETPLKLYMQ